MFRKAAALGLAALLGLALAGPADALSRPDPWITTKVKIALLTDEQVSGGDVTVDTLDGRVTLYGNVASESEKKRAEEIARGIEGAVDVRNLLQIEPAPEPPAIPDDRLAQQIETVLERDQALEGSDIQVHSVNQGVVILRGDAKTLSAHRRALEDAASVEGVRHVASEIQSPDRLGDRELWDLDTPDERKDDQATESSSFSDGWITTQVKLRYLAAEAVPAMDVNVDTQGGEVTLFGIVGSEAAKEAAVAEAKKVDGVREVHDELQVVADAKKARVEESDERIAASVRQRLDQREDLRDGTIGVAVADGVVRLTGTVDSEIDRLTALTVARSTEGVKSAVDDLGVRPDVAAER